MKRLLLFSHYNKHDGLSDHVVFLLKNLKKYYSHTLVISNSKLSLENIKQIEGLRLEFISRPNEGYDFAAWRDGMLKIGWDKMSEFDSVTIMNDTCFGPVYSFDTVFQSMGKKGYDFWGLVTHRRIAESDSPNGQEILKHLQSFFITFNKNVVESKAFQNFWSSVKDYHDVNDVIMNYETKLTHLLHESGFKYGSVLDTSKTEPTHPMSVSSGANFTIYSPEICIDNKLPLVKVKAFTHHSNPRFLVDKIRSDTDYPIKFIEDYFNEYFDPNQQLLMFDKIMYEPAMNNKVQLKVGVHLHAFYMDVAEDFIRKFKQWPFEFDLFITVSNDSLKHDVAKILDKHNLASKKIIVLPNRGYAVLPWLVVANRYLDNYDVVGHFHTKKDTHMSEWVGKLWKEDLISSLVDPAQTVINNFAANKKLGIVIPDIPRHARYLGVETYYNLTGLRAYVKSVYERLDIRSKRIIETDKILAYIYPYGMMYWYRPSALKPITELTFTEQEVPFGRLPDTSVLHAIERLFVYVSWGEGYDYRIAKLADYTTEFLTTLAVNKQAYEKERNTPLLTIGIKGAIKNKTKREMIKMAKKMPPSVKARLVRLKIRRDYNMKASSSDSRPRIKLFTHELTNTGGPRVALDLFSQIKNDPILNTMATPELYVPEGARTDNDLVRDLAEQNIKTKIFRADNILFNKGDIVIMNTIAYSETVFAVVFLYLEIGVVKHVYLYPHEFTIDSYLTPAINSKIRKLIKQNKITVYASAEQAREVYKEHFSVEEVTLMPNRIDIDHNSIFSRNEEDFDKIRFVITGTPDARKGELDVLYALTSFYNRYYKLNPGKYRDFSLTIVGLTNNYRDIYNKLYSDRLRVAAKGLGDRVILYGQQPEKRCLELIKESNFTILYSLYENLPRVVFDGLAYGHPLLRNDCSGVEEQLIDGVNGWMVKTEDWEGLVSTIEVILSKNATTNHKLALMSKKSAFIAKKYASLNYVVIDDIKKLNALPD